MPRKVRQLFADLEKAGFVNRGGKGSHRNFTHPKGVRVTLSGGPGDDARHYQERDVRRALDAGKERRCMTRKQIRQQAGRYAKFVEWSDEDKSFVGRCPELMLGGGHGNDEAQDYAALCAAAEE